jgi:hypothetical protein
VRRTPKNLSIDLTSEGDKMSPQRPAVTPKDFPKKDANELYLRLIGKSEATTPTGLVIVNDDSSYASGCNN